MPPQANEQTALVDHSEDGSAASSNQLAHVTSYSHRHENPLDNTGNRTGKMALWIFAAATLVVAVYAHYRLTTTAQSRRSALANTPSTYSKYKRVQGIGFQIYTGGAPAVLNQTVNDDDTVVQQLNPECVGRRSYGQVVGEVAPELQCYLGYDDPMQDVQRRIEIMADAVEKAYELSARDDPETLKVFIAPEFFFRGVTGAYSFQYDEIPDDPSTCGPICQILQGMENIAAQKRFEDWIFLFGTIIASDALPSEDPFDFLFYNFAPLYKGYDPAKLDFTGKRFLLPKRYVSSSDFLTPQRHLNSTVFKQLIGEPLPDHDQTVYNPHDYDQKRYDQSMWKKYKDELNGLGYVGS
jgi:hypothetical protein